MLFYTAAVIGRLVRFAYIPCRQQLKIDGKLKKISNRRVAPCCCHLRLPPFPLLPRPPTSTDTSSAPRGFFRDTFGLPPSRVPSCFCRRYCIRGVSTVAPPSAAGRVGPSRGCSGTPAPGCVGTPDSKALAKAWKSGSCSTVPSSL